MSNSDKIWRDIPGYEGHYQASELGDIRSIKFNPPRILQFGYDGSDNKIVTLCKNNKKKNVCVHRLICQTFHPNPRQKPFVIRINDDKDDTRAINVRWSKRRHYRHV